MSNTRVTIDQKIAQSNEHPFNRTFDGETYCFYDEANTMDQAHGWEQSLMRKGYKTHIDNRLIDDIMKGKWYYVYDVYFSETKTPPKNNT